MQLLQGQIAVQLGSSMFSINGLHCNKENKHWSWSAIWEPIRFLIAVFLPEIFKTCLSLFRLHKLVISLWKYSWSIMRILQDIEYFSHLRLPLTPKRRGWEAKNALKNTHAVFFLRDAQPNNTTTPKIKNLWMWGGRLSSVVCVEGAQRTPKWWRRKRRRQRRHVTRPLATRYTTQGKNTQKREKWSTEGASECSTDTNY